MALGLCNFLYGAAPTEAHAWYGKCIEHAGLPDPRILTDILSEMSWLAVTHLGDRSTADRLARESVELAEHAGLADAPRACLTLALTASQAGDHRGALAASTHARDVAQARGDQVVASVATSFMGHDNAALGDADKSTKLCLEALEHAEATGHRDAIQAAVMDAALPYLVTSNPDFASALAILERQVHVPRVDDAMAVWVDMVWGAVLVGLGRPDAVGYLVRSIRLADRLSVQGAYDQAVPLLTIAAAHAGRHREAATLIGYRDAKAAASGIGFVWLPAAVEEALTGLADRSDHAAGAALSRVEALTLVNHLQTLAPGGA